MGTNSSSHGCVSMGKLEYLELPCRERLTAQCFVSCPFCLEQLLCSRAVDLFLACVGCVEDNELCREQVFCNM